MSKRYQVFVSSTYTDLIEERKEVTQAILKCDCFPAGMELFPASNKKQWEIIKKVIDDSDFYLLIIAGRYGSLGLDDNGKKVGYTEMEFDYAVSTNKPIIVLLHDDPDSLPSKSVEKNESRRKRLDKFREKALAGRMVAFWNNKDQLHSAALNSLHQLKTNTLEAIGWIRADSINNTIKENSDFSEHEIFSILEKNNEIDEQLDFISSIDYSKKVDLFNNKKFVKYYTKFFNTRNPESVINTAINILPSNYKISSKCKEILINSSEIINSFNNLCTKFENQYFIYCVKLLNELNHYKDEFAIPIFNIIKNNTESNSVIHTCLEYLKNFVQSWETTQKFRVQIREYALTELKKTNHSLSTDELIELFVSTCIFNDDDYTCIYDLFFDSKRETKELIINALFEYYDSDTVISEPKLQREFFEICDDVYSWNNDKFTTSLLLYCLFYRTYDVFTIEEVFEMLDQFNDDVFYMFMWRLHYEEFGYGMSEYYELDENEKIRIKSIIKTRNHPREKKLLELF